MIDTIVDIQISERAMHNYFSVLVNRFFKILPIREAEEKTLPVYINSLQIEMLGCKEFVCVLQDDANMVTLLSILQYLKDTPDCPVADVKREVFRAISICNKLKARYEGTV